MKPNLLFGLTVVLLAPVFSCSKKDKVTIPEKVPVVYVAGTYKHADGDERGALWKDSTGLVWEGGPYSYFSDVFTEGENLYVSGGEDGGAAAYWKNGVKTALTNGTYDAAANAIYVKNGDVYVAGYEKNAAGNWIAKYWKNGAPVLLSADVAHGEAIDIVVNGTDVHVTGKKAGKLVHWKNGEAVVISNNNNAFPRKIFVDKNDVYIAGSEFNGAGINQAVYWKNGTMVPVTDGSFNAQAMAIVVHNGDVYVSGYESQPGRSVAKFWKNDKATTLSNATSRSAYAPAIGVSGAHVFVVFSEMTADYKNQVSYWHNGKVIPVMNKTSDAWGGSLAIK